MIFNHRGRKPPLLRRVTMYTYDEDISVKRAKQNWLWRLQHAREARLNAILAFFAGFVFGLAAAYTLVWVTTL